MEIRSTILKGEFFRFLRCAYLPPSLHASSLQCHTLSILSYLSALQLPFPLAKKTIHLSSISREQFFLQGCQIFSTKTTRVCCFKHFLTAVIFFPGTFPLPSVFLHQLSVNLFLAFGKFKFLHGNATEGAFCRLFYFKKL